MNRPVSVRLERLEAAQPPEPERPWHRIVLHEGEDREVLKAAMIASGQAEEGDNFIVQVIVHPQPRPVERQAIARPLVNGRGASHPDGSA